MISYFDFSRIAGLNQSQCAVLQFKFKLDLHSISEWDSICKSNEIYLKTPYHVKQISIEQKRVNIKK